MGWGEKAIEIRSVETGHLDGVFMHKRAQRLKFLTERNDKVSLEPSSQRFQVFVVSSSSCRSTGLMQFVVFENRTGSHKFVFLQILKIFTEL